MKTFFEVIVAAAMLCGLGYLIGRHQSRQESLECRVESVVTDAENVNFQGVKTPYTIVSYQPQFRTFLVPGEIGKPGQIVYVPKP